MQIFGRLGSFSVQNMCARDPCSSSRFLVCSNLVFYSVGVIIGAGVYSVIGAAAGLAGASLWVSFLAGAAVALLTGLSYAEMTTSFPTAGAEYVYIRRGFPRARWASFAVGWIILFGGAATATTVAVAFGGYLRSFVNVPVMASAFALLAACTLVSIWGLRESSWLNIVFTTIEVSGLLLVIAAGQTQPQIAQPLLAPVIQPGDHGGGGHSVFSFISVSRKSLIWPRR